MWGEKAQKGFWVARLAPQSLPSVQPHAAACATRVTNTQQGASTLGHVLYSLHAYKFG